MSKKSAETTEKSINFISNKSKTSENKKKLNSSKSSAILAPKIRTNNIHNHKYQGSSSSGLTKKNMMNRFEKEQHSQQIQDDIVSVRSLTLDDC